MPLSSLQFSSSDESEQSRSPLDEADRFKHARERRRHSLANECSVDAKVARLATEQIGRFAAQVHAWRGRRRGQVGEMIQNEAACLRCLILADAVGSFQGWTIIEVIAHFLQGNTFARRWAFEVIARTRHVQAIERFVSAVI